MAKTIIVNPKSLEVDAIIPQCLDNMYVSDDLFRRMIGENIDFEDDSVIKTRRRQIHGELVRSLIYSSQVVVSRQIFKNNSYFFDHFAEDAKPADFRAFRDLVSQKAIVPYLFREKSLEDQQDFATIPKGERAVRRLLQELDEIVCVRLSEDDELNRRHTEDVALNFLSYFEKLKKYSDDRFASMLPQLTKDQPLEEGQYAKFKGLVNQLAVEVFNEDLKSRDDIYRKYFTEGDSPADGRFKKPSTDNPFVLELKKLVDLKYNTNIPDIMGRHTFTPMGMPDRMTLQDYGYDHVEVGPEDVNRTVENLINHFDRKFMANQQKAMWLPFLDELSISDVAEIRKMKQWQSFIDSQYDVLESPVQVLDKIENLHNSFDQLQRGICDWYQQKYQTKKTLDRYENFVSIALEIMGKVLITGLSYSFINDNPNTHWDEMGRTLAIETLFKGRQGIIKKVNGFSVKLMYNIYDHGAKKLDRARSYSVQLMKSDHVLDFDEVVEFIDKINKIGGEWVGKVDQLADQGRK